MTRRWGFGAAALIAIAGVAIGLAFAARASRACAPPSIAVTYAAKLSVSIPRGFNIFNIYDGGPHSPGNHPAVNGHWLTNFCPASRTWAGVWAALHANGQPSNLAALELQLHSGPGPDPPDNLHLPLSLDQPWFQDHHDYGAFGPRWGSFVSQGRLYDVLYWIGPHAPENDRVAVLRALRSIRPTR
jgi:hypothetical protein